MRQRGDRQEICQSAEISTTWRSPATIVVVQDRRDRLSHALALGVAYALRDTWIPAQNHDELVPFELMLPNPKPRLRWHDDVDMVARACFACPICDARKGSPCAWAAYRVVPSWCAHNARRVLVDREEHARLLSLWAFLKD